MVEAVHLCVSGEIAARLIARFHEALVILLRRGTRGGEYSSLALVMSLIGYCWTNRQLSY
jgi:hypothetical protein